MATFIFLEIKITMGKGDRTPKVAATSLAPYKYLNLKKLRTLPFTCFFQSFLPFHFIFPF
jgi:hypothetical protein